MNLLPTYIWKVASAEEQRLCLRRPVENRAADVEQTVREIVADVRARGDAALFEYTRKFDGAALETLAVTEQEIATAVNATSSEIKVALTTAILNIRAFHEAQRPKDIRVETNSGVVCERRSLPIERVGLYIPGGTAPLPSTLTMLAIPARIAGCTEIVLVTPPNATGEIHPTVLCAAKILGVEKIYKCGGAQAVAALAYGTESIPKVDKIFGPGNAWVTEAKMQVAYDAEGAAIDMPAGPSEVLVLADENASAEFVASDLLSQAEHDRSSQVMLVSTSPTLIEAVQAELETQLAELPRRDIAIEALASSRAILASDIGEAIAISNRYAPEHLILQVANAREVAGLVRNAGSVFIGAWTPESVGDYASGTNHVLPTYGFARAFSGVSVESFMKSISFQELTPDGLRNLGPVVQTLAGTEGLHAHAQAVTLRLRALERSKR